MSVCIFKAPKFFLIWNTELFSVHKYGKVLVGGFVLRDNCGEWHSILPGDLFSAFVSLCGCIVIPWEYCTTFSTPKTSCAICLSWSSWNSVYKTWTRLFICKTIWQSETMFGRVDFWTFLLSHGLQFVFGSGTPPRI